MGLSERVGNIQNHSIMDHGREIVARLRPAIRGWGSGAAVRGAMRWSEVSALSRWSRRSRPKMAGVHARGRRHRNGGHRGRRGRQDEQVRRWLERRGAGAPSPLPKDSPHAAECELVEDGGTFVSAPADRGRTGPLRPSDDEARRQSFLELLQELRPSAQGSLVVEELSPAPRRMAGPRSRGSAVAAAPVERPAVAGRVVNRCGGGSADRDRGFRAVRPQAPPHYGCASRLGAECRRFPDRLEASSSAAALQARRPAPAAAPPPACRSVRAAEGRRGWTKRS